MSCSKTTLWTNNFIGELVDHALEVHFKNRWNDDYKGSSTQSGHYKVNVRDTIGGIIEINIKGLVRESELESYYVDD